MPELYAAAREKIKKHLEEIYGKRIGKEFLTRLFQLIEENIKNISCPLKKWDQHDIVLITYGDSIKEKNEKPLVTLKKFLSTHLENEIEIAHILPFFPYSSDEGFSVINFYEVNPELGEWRDIKEINKSFDLMFDLVINHISKESEWFQNFLKRRNPGKNYFIETDTETDLSSVTRPRSTPVLTAYNTTEGKKYVWTTFSEDQIDLNFKNPWVLFEIFRILFFYIQKGARIIRLDAIAYLWKKPGTSSIHLEETHAIVKLIRQLTEVVDPNVIILTETNVPHLENLSYFGKNYNEAEMIYQFPLPPLLLYTLHTGKSDHIVKWTKSIPETAGKGTFLNFTASHDGIGVRPLEGLLSENEKTALFNKMKKFGGFISKKTNTDGSESPYEINITYLDALKDTSEGADNLQVKRFLCSQTIMLALKGIPAFYIHSLLATENYQEGAKQTGEYRTINRKKIEYYKISRKLNDKNTKEYFIFNELKYLIQLRKGEAAFHPDSKQKVMNLKNSFYGLIRTAENGETIYSVSNITGRPQSLEYDFPEKNAVYIDLINREKFQTGSIIYFSEYQTRWLKKF